MPNFVQCPHCLRLYSAHSLPIHRPKCLDNPGRDEPPTAMAASAEFAKRKKKKKQKKAVERPRTRSLSTQRYDQEAPRVCIVCGHEFDPRDIKGHKEMCLLDWREQASALNRHFVLHEPRELRVPSVDGTTDVARENQHARQESNYTNVARCRACSVCITIDAAFSHQCTRRIPRTTVDFYY